MPLVLSTPYYLLLRIRIVAIIGVFVPPFIVLVAQSYTWLGNNAILPKVMKKVKAMLLPFRH